MMFGVMSCVFGVRGGCVRGIGGGRGGGGWSGERTDHKHDIAGGREDMSLRDRCMEVRQERRRYEEEAGSD